MKRFKMKSKRFLALFLSLVMTLPIFSTTTFATKESTSNERPIADGIYVIASALDNRMVLDVTDASKANGIQIQLWERHKADHEVFWVKYVGNGCYTLHALHSNKSLDIDASTHRLIQWDYHGGDNQKFRFVPISGAEGEFAIVSCLDGTVLEVPNGRANNGTKLVANSQRNDTTQRFRFIPSASNDRPIADGVYVIASSLDNRMVFDITDASKSNGTQIQLWEEHNADHGKVVVKYVGNGCYTLHALHSGKSFDIDASTHRLIQWDYHGGDNQKFYIFPTGNNDFVIVSCLDGSVLDVPKGGADNGVKLIAYNYHGGTNQRFRFIPAKESSSSSTTQSNRDKNYTLPVNMNLIKQTGKQKASGSCLAYALSYARNTLDGVAHHWTEYDSYGGSRGESGAYADRRLANFNLGSEKTDKARIFEEIYNTLRKGKPVIINVNKGRSSGEHFILLVGYQNVTNPKKLSESNFLMIDSVKGTPYAPENVGAVGYRLKLDSGRYWYYLP